MNSDGFLVFMTHLSVVATSGQCVMYYTQIKTNSIAFSTGDSPSAPRVYICHLNLSISFEFFTHYTAVSLKAQTKLSLPLTVPRPLRAHQTPPDPILFIAIPYNAAGLHPTNQHLMTSPALTPTLA